MATYIMSDIHGEYEKFKYMLETIHLNKDDVLYILGDIVDRGKHPIKILEHIMTMDNVIPLIGNHEYMMMECMKFLKTEITEENIHNLSQIDIQSYVDWMYNGGQSTLNEFKRLSKTQQDAIIHYVESFTAYETITINNHQYILVHAGLSQHNTIEDASLYDMIWKRNEYQQCYDENTTIISGHTPTLSFTNNPRRGKICFINNHIAIDCGACFPGGALGCLCLETMEEYYVK